MWIRYCIKYEESQEQRGRRLSVTPQKRLKLLKNHFSIITDRLVSWRLFQIEGMAKIMIGKSRLAMFTCKWFLELDQRILGVACNLSLSRKCSVFYVLYSFCYRIVLKVLNDLECDLRYDWKPVQKAEQMMTLGVISKNWWILMLLKSLNLK